MERVPFHFSFLQEQFIFNPLPSDAVGFKVMFSLVYQLQKCDPGKSQLQEAVSTILLLFCFCGFGRSYKIWAGAGLLEAGTTLAFSLISH